MRHILICPSCKTYTLSDTCSCQTKTISPKPPKYSPEDRYAHYRRLAKKQVA